MRSPAVDSRPSLNPESPARLRRSRLRVRSVGRSPLGVSLLRPVAFCRARAGKILTGAMLIFLFSFLLPGQGRSLRARLQGDEPGLAMEEDLLLIAFPLVNTGNGNATQVRLNRISLQRQELFRPEGLPLRVGDIPAGERDVIQLAFDSKGMVKGRRYPLFLQGTLQEGRGLRAPVHAFAVTRTIMLPPPAEGRGDSQAVRVEPRFTGELSDPSPFLPPPEEEPAGRPLPEATGDVVGRPDNESVAIGESGIVRGEDAAGRGMLGAVETFQLHRVGSERLTSVDTKNGAPWDPSGASVDFYVGEREIPMVFLTGNLYALLSLDGGSTYSHIDPTALFPQTSFPLDKMPQQDEGLCCDMNLIYVPSIDRFLWLLMSQGSKIGEDDKGNAINGYNRLRLAMASPAEVLASGGTSWTYWDLTTALFGFGKKAFLDYPDISFTKNFVHISVVRPDMGGFFVIRIPLTEVKNGGTINIRFTDPADGTKAAGARLTHESQDGAYWFGHASTASIRVFEWLDNSNSITWRTLSISKWRGDDPDYESLTPGGIDWLVANTSAIRGATYVGSEDLGGGLKLHTFLVAWNAPRYGSFPHPYVRLLWVGKIEGLGFWSAGPSFQLWNEEFAFHHAHLATNFDGEVGISVGAGGGKKYHATPVAGFVGDKMLYATGVSSFSLDRYGDYTAIRPHWQDTRLFSVSDYFLETNGKGGFLIWHQYRLFGR